MPVLRCGTPPTRTTAGTLLHSANPNPDKTACREFRAADLLSRAVKVDAQTFLDIVLPPEVSSIRRTSKRQLQLRVSNYKEIFKDLPQNPAKTTESDLSAKFIAAVEAARLCPGYKLVLTPDSQDPTEPEKLRVDAALFHVKDANLDGRQRWARQLLSIEFKRDGESADPFDDNGEPFEADTSDKRSAICAQIILYAEMIFAHQHRTFCITILIFGVFARMLRWDRSGVIVTKRFNYYEEPETLCQFLWRFSLVSRKYQGYDPSVELVEKDSEDAELMRRLARKNLAINDYVREYFEKSLDESWDWYRIRVDEEPTKATQPKEPAQSGSATNVDAPLDEDVQTTDAGGSQRQLKSRFYLVGKPHFRAPGMAGRGTRGYVAVDCETEEFVFLKDCWRVVADRMEKEGDVLQRLNAWPVVNIPTLLCHGDISPSQRTATQVHGEDRMHRLKVHIHYRVVVAEVGRPLREFSQGLDVVVVIYDCLRAHAQAYKECNTLHRDFNVGNLLMVEHEQLTITSNGTQDVVLRGLLTDWELSKPVTQCRMADSQLPRNTRPPGNVQMPINSQPPEPVEDDVSPRQADRTGSWQLLSAMMLQYPSKYPDLADDFEAAFHILLYLSMRYLPHNCPHVNSFMQNYFEGSLVISEGHCCGALKLSTLEAGELRFGTIDIHFGRKESDDYPLNGLIGTLLSWFKAHYIVARHDRRHKTILSNASADSRHPALSQEQPVFDWDAILGEDGVQKVTLPLPQMDTSEEDERISHYRTVAEELASHDSILALFRCYIVQETWPSDDRLPDQLLTKEAVKNSKNEARKRSLPNDQSLNSRPEAPAWKKVKRSPLQPERASKRGGRLTSSRKAGTSRPNQTSSKLRARNGRPGARSRTC